MPMLERKEPSREDALNKLPIPVLYCNGFDLPILTFPVLFIEAWTGPRLCGQEGDVRSQGGDKPTPPRDTF